MYRTLRWVCPLVALALVAAGAAADAKKTDKDKPQTKEKIASSGKFVGKVTKVEGSTKNFTVQVTFYQVDQNKVVANNQYDLKRKLEINGIVNNPREKLRQYQAHLVEMAKRNRDVYKKATKDIDLQGEDEVKVRTLVLPVEYDDKGKPKKRTKKELAALKGPNKKLPGYTAEWDNLHQGQTVEVHLAKQKGQPAKTKKAKDKDKDKDKDDELFIDRPKVVMVVIVAEPPPDK